MATIVLVHGAWHGGWCWKKVIPLLRATGHTVVAPTLTGLGDRAHLLSPEIGLDTHIEDICQVLRFEDIGEAVLVGHSYAGMVIPGVADRMGAAVKALVYLDALAPKNGESLYDLVQRPASAGPPPADVVAPASAERLGVFDPADVAWLGRRLVPHPARTLRDKLRLTTDRVERLPRLYIDCVRPAMNPDSLSSRRARGEPGWRYIALQTGHNAMMTAPNETADAILSMA
ncbi:MAG: alpha/beta hydrolase [Alphaproteobacteria bacterium]|nr:alpha/beta hydrolase [Alphaproteobacteria bacterium]